VTIHVPSTKNQDRWAGPTPEVRHTLTSRQMWKSDWPMIEFAIGSALEFLVKYETNTLRKIRKSGLAIGRRILGIAAFGDANGF